jgi:site-specific DNA-methyltransferase (adenine-specific)
MARYPDNYFDLAIVDPPYGIGESSNDNKSRSKLGKSKNYGNKNWDDNAPNQDYFNELKRVSKHQVIWGANHFIENIPNANSSCWIVWDKVNGENDFADCELAYCMKEKEIRIHPTQKPIKLYEYCLTKYANEGDKILDTHLGSGSIAIACHDYGFELTACELDKEYYDKAIQRIVNHTNQTKLF